MELNQPAFEDIVALVHRQLANRHAAFSIGVMGAVGEYFIADDEPQIKLMKTGGTAQTWGGGIAINLPRDITVTAYESVTGVGARWTQGVLFSYPVAEISLVKATGLLEIGPDIDALKAEDRPAILFDMGLGHPHFSFGLRTNNKNLIAQLRDATGRDLFKKAPNVLKTVMAVEPHRVVKTAIGRIEATNPFMQLDGPHTHFAPDLTGGGTAHAATLPVPSGHALGLSLHPSPIWMSSDGIPTEFNMDAYSDFQKIYTVFAPTHLREEKQRLAQAIKSGINPAEYVVASDKTTRLQTRATLRQIQQVAPDTPNLDQWFAKLDRTGWIG